MKWTPVVPVMVGWDWLRPISAADNTRGDCPLSLSLSLSLSLFLSFFLSFSLSPFSFVWFRRISSSLSDGLPACLDPYFPFQFMTCIFCATKPNCGSSCSHSKVRAAQHKASLPRSLCYFRHCPDPSSQTLLSLLRLRSVELKNMSCAKVNGNYFLQRFTNQTQNRNNLKNRRRQGWS